MSTDRPQDSLGSMHDPTFFAGPTYQQDGILMKQRVVAFESSEGPVVGTQIDVTFSIDQPPAKVWPYFSDFNLWQNSHGYFYPARLRDLYNEPNGALGSETFRMTTTSPDGETTEWPEEYRVLKAIPERAILIHQPVEEHRNGGVSRGFHVCLLQESGDGGSVATLHMEHGTRLDGSEEGTIEFWQGLMPVYEQFWTESFISELRRLASEGSR